MGYGRLTWRIKRATSESIQDLSHACLTPNLCMKAPGRQPERRANTALKRTKACSTGLCHDSPGHDSTYNLPCALKQTMSCITFSKEFGETTIQIRQERGCADSSFNAPVRGDLELLLTFEKSQKIGYNIRFLST